MLQELRARLGGLASLPSPTPADQDEFERTAAEFRAVDRERMALVAAADTARDAAGREHDAQVAALRARIESGMTKAERGSPFGSAITGGGSDGLRMVDADHRRGMLADESAERASLLLSTGTVRDRAIFDQWYRTAGDPAYVRAFALALSDPNGAGHRRWGPDELAAYNRVEKMRAQSLVDAEGGYLVPPQVDPALIPTTPGYRGSLQGLARRVAITGDVWTALRRTDATAVWSAEAAEATETSITLDDHSITVHRYDAMIPFSFEVEADAPQLIRELGSILREAADDLHDAAFVGGNGVGRPHGLFPRLLAEGQTVNAGGESITEGDVYTLRAALGERWQAGASFLAHPTTVDTLSRMETPGGRATFAEVANGNLLRRPLHELSRMDAAAATNVTAVRSVLAYGDWNATYTMVDRIGARVELVPHLFGPNRRPTGQRGLFLYGRIGGDVVLPQAARLLRVTTTA